MSETVRKVTYGAACSLDLYIARHDDGVDWLLWSDDVSALVEEFWKTIDTVLVGRKTWEVGVKQGMKGAYPGMRTVLFSRTVDPATVPELEVVAENAGDFVRALKQQDGKGICVMGGGDLARTLFEEDLIDEVGMNLHPILLGSGIPLFQPLTREISLELIEQRPLQHGCVNLLYRVKR